MHTPRSRAVTRSRAVMLATTAALVAGSSAAFASMPASSPTWLSTATRALSPTAALKLGAAPASLPMTVSLVLTSRDKAGQLTMVRAETTPSSVLYHQFLTPAEYLADFAPTAAQAQAAATYLSSSGFADVHIAANRLLVTGQGTAAQTERAFRTSIDMFRQGRRTVFANVAPAEVPATAHVAVSAVLGLNDFQLTLPIKVTKPAAPSPTSVPTLKAPLSGYTPVQFQTVYGATGTPTGQNTSIAIMAEGNLTQTITSLRIAEKAYNLPQVTVTVVPTGPASPDTSGTIEWELDTQTSTGMANSVKHLYLYDATSLTDADLSHEINTFVTQDLAQAGSASLGECDLLAFLDGSMQSIDQSLEQAALQGQTFFASSGDTGASCALAPTNGVPDSGLLTDTNYPASSTWTTGVGGTTLVTTSSDAYVSELAWNAGGGGISALEFPGYWTADANPAQAAGDRGVPDIAMDADLTTGEIVYDGHTQYLVGGTSLSSPLALGSWARIQSAHGNRLGDAALAFYALYNKANPSPTSRVATPGFHDIVAGTNGVYFAGPGWDFTTGIGSIQVNTLDSALGPMVPATSVRHPAAATRKK